MSPEKRKRFELNFNDPQMHPGGLIIEFRRNGKLLLILEGAGSHFTLHPGHKSGVIDLHRTKQSLPANDPSRYDTIFSIPKTEILRVLYDLGPRMLTELLSLLHPIRVGWMARRHLGVVGFPSESLTEHVSRIRIGPGPQDSADSLTNRLVVPKFLDEVFEHPNTGFMLIDHRRRPPLQFGLLFPYLGENERVKLRWIKMEDLQRWAARMERLLVEAFEQIPQGTGMGCAIGPATVSTDE